jgi:competence protein ComFB
MESNAAADIKEKVALHNCFEDIVIQKTREIVSKIDMCQCEKCFLDICALVLNQIPPKYVTTTKGNLMAKLPALSPKKEQEMMILITKCARMVQEKPFH